MSRCPLCGDPCREVIATAEEVASEIAQRDAFFRERFAGPARRDADLRDISHVAFDDAAAVMRCSGCDVFVRETRGDPADLFAGDCYDERTLKTLRRYHVQEFARKEWVRRLLPPRARVLEIGSYVGGFLEAARSWDWRITGIDVGADTSRFTQRHGHHVLTGSLDEADLEPASCDGIFIWNCFEQLPDPFGTLRRCRALLRSSGVLLVRTPDAALYSAKRGQIDFLAYSNLLGFPHRLGFTERSLGIACAAAGFTLESLRREPAMRPHRRRMAAWAQAEERGLGAAAWIEAVFRRS